MVEATPGPTTGPIKSKYTQQPKFEKAKAVNEMYLLNRKLKLRPNLSKPFIQDVTSISERKKGNIQTQFVDEAVANAYIDINSIFDSQGPGISVQVWIYKLTTPSLSDLYMGSTTSFASASVMNVC